MRGLKRKTAIILASAVVTTSILAGGTLTAFAAGPDGAGFRQDDAADVARYDRALALRRSAGAQGSESAAAR